METQVMSTPAKSAPVPTPQESIQVLQKEIHSIIEEYSEHGEFYHCTGEERRTKYAELEQKITQVGNLTAQIAEERSGISLDDINTEERILAAREAKHELTRASERNLVASKERNELFFSDKGYAMRKVFSLKEEDGIPLNKEEQEYKDAMEASREEADNARKALSLAHVEVNKYDNNLTEYDKISLRKLSKAYLEVLKEERDFAPEGTKLKTHERATSANNKRAQKIMESQIHHFPSAWVESSNESRDSLVVRESDDRAHYSDRRYHNYLPLGRKARVSEMTQTEYEDALRENERVNMGPRIRVIKKLSEEDEKKYRKSERLEGNPGGFILVEMKLYETYSYGLEGHYWDEKKNRPAGRGWEKMESPVTGEEVWAKDETDYPTFQYGSAEMTIPKASAKQYKEFSSVRDKVDSTAIHEFSHRCEATYKNNLLGKIQQTFIERRRTNGEDGTKEELTQIYPDATKKEQREEMGYRDSFSKHYSGKVYEDHHREVLSMGMEMIFKQSHDGMTRIGSGVSHMGADKDYRNFILGVLRTV